MNPVSMQALYSQLSTLALFPGTNIIDNLYSPLVSITILNRFIS